MSLPGDRHLDYKLVNLISTEDQEVLTNAAFSKYD